MDEKEDIFKYGLKGGNHQEEPVKEIHVEKIVKNFLIKAKKLFMPLLFIIIIIGIFYAGYSFKKIPLTPACPAPSVCEKPLSCPELDFDLCPTKTEKVTVIKYACQNGLIVDDLKDCSPLNFIKITSPYKETDNSITLSIDKLEFETQGSYSKITEIDYTIINMGDHEIKPIVLVNLYSENDPRSEQGIVHEVFDDNEYINKNAWIIKKQNTNIGFGDTDMIIRLILKDTLPDPDKKLVVVKRPLN